MNARIAVTGMGICSPIGTSVDQFAAQLRSGGTGIEAYEGIISGRAVCAGIVSSFDSKQPPLEHSDCYDRTAKMAIDAAQEALSDASIRPDDYQDRIGLVLGTSHGGRSQLDRFVKDGSVTEGREVSNRVLVKSAHFQQTSAVAACLAIHGPTVTLSNACSSSGAAIAYGIELLRSGQCDVVVAGGADGFSKLTLSGFSSLGAVSDSPCAPFSEPIGLSLGDGSGFIILERSEDADRRDAKKHAELWGYGLSWDAYHITAPEPSGEGMVRAMNMAVSQAGIDRKQIGYVNVHGTGTRSNDVAEVVGLKDFFGGDDHVPPISATKSQTGHMLGASSVVGVISSIVGMNGGWLPPTSNFTEARSGCDLDCIPNESRPANYSAFMAQSAAFAGANAVIVGGKPRLKADEIAVTRPDPEEIVITGMGVVSPIGFTLDDYFESLRLSRSGIGDVTEAALEHCRCQKAGYVADYKPRKLMPTLKLRRVDRVASFATIASAFALQNSGRWPVAGNGSDVGLVVGVARGAASSYEKYLGSVENCQWDNASAVHFPNLVMSSVGGQVTSMLGLRGITSSLVGSTSGGLQALMHGVELFRRNPTQQALVVVASDEIAPLFFKLFDELGVLRNGQPESPGMTLGEGAAAIVLERKSTALERDANPLAKISGYGMTNDAAAPRGLDSSGHWMTRAIENSLRMSGLGAGDIDSVYRNHLNIPSHDRREQLAVDALLDAQIPRCSVNPLQGVGEASSGLFHAIAAVLGMQQNTILGRLNDGCANVSPSKSLVCASGDDGSNASVVIEKI